MLDEDALAVMPPLAPPALAPPTAVEPPLDALEATDEDEPPFGVVEPPVRLLLELLPPAGVLLPPEAVLLPPTGGTSLLGLDELLPPVGWLLPPSDEDRLLEAPPPPELLLVLVEEPPPVAELAPVLPPPPSGPSDV